jgi:hypothetical protein
MQKEMFQIINCLYLRMAVTDISLLETDMVRQSYELTKAL